MNDVKGVYDMLVGLMAAGRTPESAQNFMLELGIPQELIEASVQRYREISESIVSAREPEAMVDPKRIMPWYWGARQGDSFWPALEAYHEKNGFPTDALRSLDQASTKVVSHLPPPWQGNFTGRGLVLGYVQSGKTSNFTATIAKAADAGYRLFIVMSGLHNNLRRQTQLRLDRELVNLSPRRWFQLTDEDGDFGHPGNADAILAQDQLKLLAVVKKNKSRLTNLLQWLESAQPSTRANCPVLLIDDEADQASVNTGGDNDPSVINRLIRKVLGLKKVAYVGYTATPFANIFIDPSLEDLYPRDFIIDLPRPSGYFGPERVFGREPLSEDDEAEDGLDMIRIVPEDEVRILRPPRKKAERDGWDPVLTPSLGAAIEWFVLATAARRARSQDGHSSMLIHTTQLASLHDRYVDPVRSELNMIRRKLRSGDTGSLARMWEAETGRVDAEFLGEAPTTFGEVLANVPRVLDDTTIVIDNYLSDDRLDYPDDRGSTVIVIGGNTLSRGLTLEGLVVSYFLRTSSAYDTLLQMARWFGYRRGFADLPRIWMTAELWEYFQFLATVEAEIRTDIERYELEDQTPAEFAVRVRTHPELAVTSALKMQAAQPAAVSYSGRRIQTILFEHTDRAWLGGNLSAAKTLVSSASLVTTPTRLERGRWLIEGVPVSLINAFLRTYEFHPNSRDLVSENILKYIERQNRHGELVTWNVVVMGKSGASADSTIDLGLRDGPVGAITRTAMRTVSGDYANIKSLMSKVDRVADLGMNAEARDLTHKELQARRPTGIGLLLLYPINRNSHSEPRQTDRTDLDAVEDVIGVGLVFPDATHDEAVTYVSVALSPGDVDEPEPDEFVDREADHDVKV